MLPLHCRNLLLHCFCALTTAVPNGRGQPGRGLRLQGEPEPLPGCLLPDKAPHFVGCRLQLGPQYLLAPSRVFAMERSGGGLKALDQKVQQPAEADAHCAADSASRASRQQQAFTQCPVFVCDAAVLCDQNKRPTTRFASMGLLSRVNVTVPLIPS